jgi:hypothetical protein
MKRREMFLIRSPQPTCTTEDITSKIMQGTFKKKKNVITAILKETKN